MLFEQTAAGPIYFVEFEGSKYYVAKTSRLLWDVTVPLPAPCFKYQDMHWQWACGVGTMPTGASSSPMP